MAKDRNMPPPAPEASNDQPNRGDSAVTYDAAYTSLKDFVLEPNAFLAQCLARLAPDGAPPTARALEIGMGQGRNAIALAEKGYATTGIDRSPVGVRAVRHRAAELGLNIAAEIADAMHYDFGLARWDLIAMLYYPAPMALLERLKAAVKPGGHIVVERFSQSKNDSGLDAVEAKSPSPMLRSFLDWNVLHYKHDVFPSDWHWNGESPTGAIIRLLARKP